MEYAEQYIALCLGGAGSASAPAPGIVLDGTAPFTLDMMVRGIPVESAASVLHQEGALDVRLTAKGFSFWREGFGIFSTSSDGETFQQGEWNHLCIAYEPGTVRLFVNGALDCVVQKPCKGSACSKPFVVGTGVKGGVRQLRLFDRAFGGMEVQDLLLMDFADIRASSYASSLAAFYDFGCKAPVERVSGSTIALQGDAKMRALFPSVQLRGSAYLAISNEPGINPAGRRNDAYSIQAWIRLEPFDGQDAYTVFANGDLSEEAGMSLYVARDEASWRLCALRGDEEPMISKGLVQPQLWTNVCLTYDGLQTQSLYVDGVLDSQISTCLPISDVLEEPKLRIGADLSNGSDNGKDCFSGAISRVDVWNRALTAEEVKSYAAEEPSFDAEGLQASYDLSFADINNAVSSDPIGLRNGVVVDDVRQEAGTTPMPTACPPKPDPLSDEELRRCRAACLKGNDSSPLRVSRLEKDGYVCFVGHYHDGSQTIACAKEGYDEWTLWYIELVLLLVGGVLTVLAGVRIAGGNKITNFIVTKIMPNPAFRSLFSGPVSFKTIITFFYLLKANGLLTPLLKAAMSGLRWFKVAWSIAVMTTMAVAICTGMGLIYYAAAFADLAVSLIVHLADMPASGTLLPCGVSALFFDHHAVTSTVPLPTGEADAIALAWNGTQLVSKPEWDSSKSDPCAYCIEAVKGKKITIKANLTCSDPSLASVKVRAVDKSRSTLLGDSDEIAVTFRYGRASGATLAFPRHALANKGVGKHELQLEWQCYYQGGWKKMSTTKHVMYTLLSYPNEPWLSRNGSSQYPWVSLLEKACSWASGKKTPAEAAGTIERKVNEGLGLEYDTSGWGRSYYCTNTGYFLLGNFLRQTSSLVNCTDCAIIVTTFANALGCDLHEARMEDPSPSNKQQFTFLKVKSIGKKVWQDGRFTYHEVAVSRKAATTNNQDRAVYDACCTLNGSDTPSSASKRDPVLSNGMNFSDFDDTEPIPRTITARSSYREHFATNDAAGVGRCAYVWSSETRRPAMP